MSGTDYAAELEKLGYQVGEALPGVLFVGGYGIESYFDLTDTETMDGMIDPALHAERIEALEDPPLPPAPSGPSLEERVAEIEATLAIE